MSLINVLSDVGQNGTKYSTFSLWPHADFTTLHSGMPLVGRHVVVAVICSFHSGMNSINVGDIRFLAEGGGILKYYNHVPMTLNEVVNVLNKMPKLGGGENILLSKQLYTILYSNS